MTKLFISYRRKDNEYLAKMVRDSVTRRLGADKVFFDVDSLRLGADFRASISAVMAEVDLVLVLIGPQWEPERLSSADDPVRLELLEAERFHKHVIPVLHAQRPMPSRADLPDDLAWLADRHAFTLGTAQTVDRDLDQLGEQIVQAMTDRTMRRSTTRTIPAESIDHGLSQPVTSAGLGRRSPDPAVEEPLELRALRKIDPCPLLVIGLGGFGARVSAAVRSELTDLLLALGEGTTLPAAWRFVDIDVPYSRERFDDLVSAPDEYVSAAPPVGTLAQAQDLLHSVASPERLEGWAELDWAASIPIAMGAGQFRAAGRAVGLLASAGVTAQLKRSLRHLESGSSELRGLAERAGGGAVAQPLVVVVASLAGGTGSGMLVDICDMVVDLTYGSVRVLPVVVGSNVITDRIGAVGTGFAGNSLAGLSELINARSRPSSSGHLLRPWFVDRSGPRGLGGSPVSAVAAVVRGAATDAEVRGVFLDFPTVNDRASEPRRPPGSLHDGGSPGLLSVGHARMGVGGRQFVDYAAARISVEVLRATVEGGDRSGAASFEAALRQALRLDEASPSTWLHRFAHGLPPFDDTGARDALRILASVPAFPPPQQEEARLIRCLDVVRLQTVAALDAMIDDLSAELSRMLALGMIEIGADEVETVLSRLSLEVIRQGANQSLVEVQSTNDDSMPGEVGTLALPEWATSRLIHALAPECGRYVSQLTSALLPEYQLQVQRCARESATLLAAAEGALGVASRNDEGSLFAADQWPAAFEHLIEQDVPETNIGRSVAHLLIQGTDGNVWWPIRDRDQLLTTGGQTAPPLEQLEQLDAAVRRWMQREDSAFSGMQDLTVGEYLALPTTIRHGRTGLDLLDEMRERSRPQIEVDRQALSQQNQVPFAVNYVVRGTSRTRGSSTSTDPTEAREAWATDLTAIEMFSCVSTPLHPGAIESLTGPILGVWKSAAGQPISAAGFWRGRRARPLHEFIPVSPGVLHLMIRGWYVSRLLGAVSFVDLKVGWRIRHADSHGNLIDSTFPWPIFPLADRVSADSIVVDRRLWLPALLEVLPLAMLQSGRNADALTAYEGLRQTGQQALSWMGLWLERGEVAISVEKPQMSGATRPDRQRDLTTALNKLIELVERSTGEAGSGLIGPSWFRRCADELHQMKTEMPEDPSPDGRVVG